jgi:hypothetical protein
MGTKLSRLATGGVLQLRTSISHRELYVTIKVPSEWKLQAGKADRKPQSVSGIRP